MAFVETMIVSTKENHGHFRLKLDKMRGKEPSRGHGSRRVVLAESHPVHEVMERRVINRRRIAGVRSEVQGCTTPLTVLDLILFHHQAIRME